MAKSEHVSRRRFTTAGLCAGGTALLSTSNLFLDPTTALAEESIVADSATIKRGTNTTFASVKQIDAGLLNVGYAEAGPADGPAVILLHGWPYDVYSFIDVAPLLASKGFKV